MGEPGGAWAPGPAPLRAPLCFPSRGRGSGRSGGEGLGRPGAASRGGGKGQEEAALRSLRPLVPRGYGSDLLYFFFGIGAGGKSWEGCGILLDKRNSLPQVSFFPSPSSFPCRICCFHAHTVPKNGGGRGHKTSAPHPTSVLPAFCCGCALTSLPVPFVAARRRPRY